MARELEILLGRAVDVVSTGGLKAVTVASSRSSVASRYSLARHHGLRVVLAHHYHRVDPGQVWVIAATEVPRLVQDLRSAGRPAGERN